MTSEKAIERLLRRLGVNSSYRGFHYSVFGIWLAVADKNRLTYITKDLYPDIAKKYRTSVFCVERDIRTVVDVIWYHGDRELLNSINDGELERKPKNRKFIEMLADYTRNSCNETK